MHFTPPVTPLHPTRFTFVPGAEFYFTFELIPLQCTYTSTTLYNHCGLPCFFAVQSKKGHQALCMYKEGALGMYLRCKAYRRQV